ncbi:MAG: hypothetical protein KGD65_17075 [Candidatus Lokiarchaeota archaeon]|nr:hypothetical protein [Candidatus Lokiarchaeota archaeon]
MNYSLVIGFMILILGILISLFLPLPMDFHGTYNLRIWLIVINGVILIVFWFILKIIKNISSLLWILLVLSAIGVVFAILGFIINNIFPFWLVLDPRQTIPEMMLFISSATLISFSIKILFFGLSLKKEEPVSKAKQSNIIIITAIVIHLGMVMLLYLIVIIANSLSSSPTP